MQPKIWPPRMVTVFVHPQCDNNVAMQTIPISRLDIDRTDGKNFVPVGYVYYSDYSTLIAALKLIRKAAKKNKVDPDLIFNLAADALAKEGFAK